MPMYRIIDYPLPDGTVCDGRPLSAPRVMRKYHGTMCNFFQEMWKWMLKGASQCCLALKDPEKAILSFYFVVNAKYRRAHVQ
jgi:hypothetical protein